ncbi:TIR-like domain-containing protein [Corallococcus sp. CA054B]|uniref:TIR domain-containing protein n=1 Tax=Corallococcus sp. CA054B TaxID=2316734 RepID=UPI000EA129AB|nr:TIR domain-containing protein [Corallococcus sp. CA054B]RKG63926.1 TIR-like domain-containing protein [Corallococcus sp. CA054B]
MGRRVFFSFHYERDIFRVNVVRNSNMVKGSIEAGYIDSSLWEEAKLKGDAAIKRMINGALDNTSVTVVLIGQETASRPYVRYEIEQSLARSNGLLGIYIHNISDARSFLSALQINTQGDNPFRHVHERKGGFDIPLSYRVNCYDWINDNGYQHFGNWVEQAARDAGR